MLRKYSDSVTSLRRKVNNNNTNVNENVLKPSHNILVTSSFNPNKNTKLFIRELCYILPNAQKINRGRLSQCDLIQLCNENNVQILIEISGKNIEGNPSTMKLKLRPISANDALILDGFPMEKKPYNIILPIIANIFNTQKTQPRNYLGLFLRNNYSIFVRAYYLSDEKKNFDISKIIENGPLFVLTPIKIISTISKTSYQDIAWANTQFF
uniref:U3 small nucleolar ribonucleoprotein protein IMP4-like n=1 Tax=Dermatophagoides pteronyssinus TaxID=6956 RepID=A0A6P6YBU9_DERPT|nr:U3 small nucleolar ribonucleoprotein protein IMP4-like [Dermatophagoides pteronyssinus]